MGSQSRRVVVVKMSNDDLSDQLNRVAPALEPGSRSKKKPVARLLCLRHTGSRTGATQLIER